MTRLERRLQSETEQWLREDKITKFFKGVAEVQINGKKYLLSGWTIAGLVKEAEHGIR